MHVCTVNHTADVEEAEDADLVAILVYHARLDFSRRMADGRWQSGSEAEGLIDTRPSDDRYSTVQVLEEANSEQQRENNGSTE
jgi:hypothetical protein